MKKLPQFKLPQTVSGRNRWRSEKKKKKKAKRLTKKVWEEMHLMGGGVGEVTAACEERETDVGKEKERSLQR